MSDEHGQLLSCKHIGELLPDVTGFRCGDCGFLVPKKTVVDRIAKLEQQITALEGEREWVPVSERLPEGPLPQHVQVTALPNGGNPYVTSCSYLPRYGGFSHHHDKVTHWMPLPAPPQHT